MSVTFAPVTTGTGTWEARCMCVEDAPAPQASFGSYGDASMWLSLYKAAPYALRGCTDEMCLAYGPYLSEVQSEGSAPSVNVSNMNARDLLDVLGIEVVDGDLWGTMSAEDFEGRVLMALAVAPVSAERLTEQAKAGQVVIGPEGIGIDPSREAEGATFVLCGRPEGYVQERLESLREVATFAREHGLEVSWG